MLNPYSIYNFYMDYMDSYQETQLTFNKRKKERNKHLKGARMRFFYYSKKDSRFERTLSK